MTYDVENPGPALGQTQIFGRVRLVDWIITLKLYYFSQELYYPPFL
jgi:hypothetical protein